MNMIAVTAGAAYIHAVAAVLNAIAWPTVAVVVLVIYRKPISEALTSLIELRLGSAILKFERAAATVRSSLPDDSFVDSKPGARLEGEDRHISQRDYYETLADQNPLSAILKAYQSIEMWFDRALSTYGIENRDGARKYGVTEMAAIASRHGLIPTASRKQVDGLTIMRDLAAQRTGDQTTPAQAREFLLLVDGVLHVLDAELEKVDRRNERTRNLP